MRPPIRRLTAALYSTIALLAALGADGPAFAANSYWSHDPHAPTRLRNYYSNIAVGDVAVTDGAGGAFLFWEDSRNGNKDIYGTHIRYDGSLDPAWPADGLGICTAAGDQTNIRAVPDGSGGVVVCWLDARSGITKPYLTWLSSSGAVINSFPANGLGVETSLPGADGPPQIYFNTFNYGVDLVWTYAASAANHDIYGAHVYSGVYFWWSGLVTTAADQTAPALSTDSGNITVAYVEGGNTIMAAGFSSSTGALAAGPAVMSNASFTNTSPRIAIASPSNGNMVVWLATNGSGTAPAAGYFFGGINFGSLGLLTAQSNVGTPYLGDMIYSGSYSNWIVFGQGSPTVTYVQQFTTSSFSAPTQVDPKTDWVSFPPQICADGAGGVIAASNDVLGPETVKAGRVMSNNTLAPLWASVASGGAPIAQSTVGAFVGGIATDGNSGAIVLTRDGYSNGTVYANRVDRWGALDAAPEIASIRDIPNDQGGEVRVIWNASYLDAAYPEPISAYWLWRQVPGASAQRMLNAGAERYDPASSGTPKPGAIRFDEATSAQVRDAGARSTAGATPTATQVFAWQFVASQVANGFPQYSYVAPTTGDSTGTLNPRTVFMVEARSASVNVGWTSLPDSGYSVDNLAPLAPVPFVGTFSAGVSSMHWSPVSATDLASYRLYRGDNSTFVPGPSNLIASPTDTAYTDAAGSPHYYRVSAVDIHGNEGPSTLLLPAGSAGVGGSLPAEISFAPPAPNPARGLATLRYGLPRDAAVRLEVYDVNGRRVRTLTDGASAAGDHALTWDLRDDAGHPVEAGLYLARFEAEGHVFTRRLVALR